MDNNDCSFFYVDESGDLTFFVKNKPARLDGQTCSKTFMIGAVRIKSDIKEVENAFNNLRQTLINDPFVQKIPSSRRLNKMFHAKDDADIVRREVFKLIKTFDFSVLVIVRRKSAILEQVVKLYQTTGVKTRINEKDIYNVLVSRLFKPLLHKNDCKIYFSQRGKTFNDNSLRAAINTAKKNFYISNHIENAHNIEIHSSHPEEHIGLQIIDYYLWALNRLYEKNDDSYFNLLKDDYKLIIDVDDTRKHPFGEHYNSSHPISLIKIKKDS